MILTLRRCRLIIPIHLYLLMRWIMLSSFTQLLVQEPIFLMSAILLIGLLISLALPASMPELVKKFTLILSLIVLAIGVVSCLFFDRTLLGFQFVSGFTPFEQYNTTFLVGADGISMVFLMLTLFIFPLLFLAS